MSIVFEPLPHRAPAAVSVFLPWAAVVLVVAVLLGAYWDSVVGIVGIWMRSETFAHGLVVVPIALWLAWRKRFWLYAGAPQGSLHALPLVMLAGCAWLAGIVLSVASLEHLALLALLVTSLWCVLGNRLALELCFPLAFLFFGAPVGEFLVPTLMHHTAEFTVWAVRLSGVPVFQEGLHFVLPNGRWSVVEACSGIRYLIASLMVGTLYAYLTYTGIKKRLIFIAFAAVLPIIANWLRAYLIVMLGFLSDNQLAAGADHLVYGWVFFGIVIIAMFWIGSFWRDPDPLPTPVPAVVDTKSDPRRHVLVLLALLAGLAVWPWLANRLAVQDRAVDVSLQLPAGQSDWSFAPTPLMDFVPELEGYRAQASGRYSGPRGEVGVWAALYAHQVEGREMVSWANTVASAKGTWQRLAIGNAQLAGHSVATLRVRGPAADLDLFRWYLIDGRVVGSDIAAKLRLGQSMLSGKGDAGIFVIVATPAGGDSKAVVEAFLAANGAQLEARLTQAAEALR